MERYTLQDVQNSATGTKQDVQNSEPVTLQDVKNNGSGPYKMFRILHHQNPWCPNAPHPSR